MPDKSDKISVTPFKNSFQNAQFELNMESNAAELSEMKPYKYYPLQSTKGQLASIWYISGVIRKQGTLLAIGGFMALATALYMAMTHTGDKENILNLTIFGTSAYLLGVSHRQTAKNVEYITSRELKKMEEGEENRMTPREVRTTQRVLNSLTAQIMKALRPTQLSSKNMFLSRNKGYQLWKKQFSHQNIKE